MTRRSLLCGDGRGRWQGQIRLERGRRAVRALVDTVLNYIILYYIIRLERGRRAVRALVDSTPYSTARL